MPTITAAQARELVEEFIRHGDESIFADAIAALITREDEGNFAIMQGSGNDTSTFGKALHLFRKAGFIDKAYALDAIDRAAR